MRADTTSAIRAQRIAALQRHAATADGAARDALEARLAELQALDAGTQDQEPGINAPAPRPSPLRELVEGLAGNASPTHCAYPDVPALADFRQLWSALRADSQVQQSVAHRPTDAGPLNSTALASRAIALMRELSPGYLRAFLAYVDDLAWLEQWGGAGAVNASGAAATPKRTRRKVKGAAPR